HADGVGVDANVALGVEVLFEKVAQRRRGLRDVELFFEEAVEAVDAAAELLLRAFALVLDRLLEPREHARRVQLSNALRQRPLVMRAVHEPNHAGERTRRSASATMVAFRVRR